MNEQKPKLLVKKSLVAMAKNAVGSHQYRNLYIQMPDGKIVDALNNGELACASFVSGLLSVFGLINRGYATVKGLVEALPKHGWQNVSIADEPELGDLIIWEPVDFGGSGMHSHVGIYVGGDMAVSNNDKLAEPSEHDWKFEGGRKVIGLWRYDFDNWEKPE